MREELPDNDISPQDNTNKARRAIGGLTAALALVVGTGLGYYSRPSLAERAPANTAPAPTYPSYNIDPTLEARDVGTLVDVLNNNLQRGSQPGTVVLDQVTYFIGVVKTTNPQTGEIQIFANPIVGSLERSPSDLPNGYIVYQDLTRGNTVHFAMLALKDFADVKLEPATADMQPSYGKEYTKAFRGELFQTDDSGLYTGDLIAQEQTIADQQ